MSATQRKRRPGGKEESNIITPEWESGQLEAGHPYGVKPAGNGLYESGSEDGVVANILDTSLGALRAIDDRQVPASCSPPDFNPVVSILVWHETAGDWLSRSTVHES